MRCYHVEWYAVSDIVSVCGFPSEPSRNELNVVLEAGLLADGIEKSNVVQRKREGNGFHVRFPSTVSSTGTLQIDPLKIGSFYERLRMYVLGQELSVSMKPRR